MEPGQTHPNPGNDQSATRRRWMWGGLAVVVAAALAGLAGLYVLSGGRLSASETQTDCQVAREFIAYNKSQGEFFTDAFDSEEDREASVDDYRKWAEQLRTYSTQISAPEVSAPATQLAATADEFVELVEQVRADKSVPADPSAPPPWAQRYAELAEQFHDDLVSRVIN
ncbi:hypothetical protein KL864_34370 [Mycolicibacterium goodii]|uniref:hypothetical protein n=1 Tax=Mycolicibacterium goodii TaxID=134601 RepID=UPI001BDC88AC|nr:hypothetical protein [Mycolicibacterium goodii]MBU8820947.1 hypothetical protein [Mycolicibacterium goodii]